MSIAYDSSAAGQTASATSLTFAHKCTGSNVVLFVGFSLSANNAPTVTYNGVSMAQVDVQPASNANTYMYYLAIGTGDATNHNVIISTGASSQVITASSYSVTGASQTSPIDAHNKVAGSSLTLSVVGTRCWIVATSGAAIGGGVTYSAGSGFTIRQQTNQGGDMNGLEDSNGIVPSGSNTVAFSTSSGSPSTVIAASIAVQPTANSLTAAVGSLTLTGFAASLVKARNLAASTGVFILTGFNAALSYTVNKWPFQPKSAAPSWTDQPKS